MDVLGSGKDDIFAIHLIKTVFSIVRLRNMVNSPTGTAIHYCRLERVSSYFLMHAGKKAFDLWPTVL